MPSRSRAYDVGSSFSSSASGSVLRMPGHDVLALRVREVVAVRHLLAGARVAREGHAGARVVAPVAEHHRLHVHRGAEVVADLVLAPVVDRALAVPRL